MIISCTKRPGWGVHAVAAAMALAASFVPLRSTQDAIANGDTRALNMVHSHTGESLRITYKRDGSFDSSALEKLNWFLRDWRVDEPINMSPHLFDTVWAVYREVGASEPIKIMSAYRSPGTNAMLRRRSRAVAKESQHMRGNAMDVHIPGVSMAKAREIGMRLHRGGVGYYPSAGSPFVHLDVGTVRSWPRMTRDQLERIFPDGKTVHLPADGKPLANYEAALAEVQARGGSALDYGTVTSFSGKSLWALLFGGGGEDEDSGEIRQSSRTAARNARNPRGRGASQPIETAGAPAPSSDSVMVASVAPVAQSFAARAPVARPAPAPVTEPEPVKAEAPKAEPKAEPKAAPALEIAALPVPPIRPRGAKFEQMVAAAEPLPPIRPAEARQVAMLQKQAEADAPKPVEAPLQAIAGMPLPPLRSVAPANAAVSDEPKIEAPRQVAGLPLPPARPVGAASAPAAAPLPSLMAKTEPASAPLTQSYAAVQVPQPPARPQTVAARPISPPVQRPIAVRTSVDPLAKNELTALIATQPAAQARPNYVVTVGEPPVAREVKRDVYARKLDKSAVQPAQGQFSGGFIRPLAKGFSQKAE